MAALLAVCAEVSAQGMAEHAKYMVNIFGECIKAELDGKDHLAECTPVVIHVLYQNGRASYLFLLDAKTAISFSGTKDSNPAPDKYRLELDSLNKAGNFPIETYPGSGSCTMDGVLEKGVAIRCEFKGDKISASFALQGNGELKWDKKPEQRDSSGNIRAAVGEAFKIMGKDSTSGLHERLQQCYGEAAKKPDFNVLENCIAMDFAGFMMESTVAAQARKTDKNKDKTLNDLMTSGFQPEVVEKRIRSALEAFGIVGDEANNVTGKISSEVKSLLENPENWKQ